jgi:3-hydroxyacyl-[acyl-carrier-protein] dehydratase
MRFSLIDRIVDLQPGKTITAVKCVSLAEEYLQDHFPRFPVLPGVMMLEAMTQASAWLIRAGEDFAHSMVTLQEARNVKYSDFVAPGSMLTVTADLMKQDERYCSLKTKGTIDGRTAVSARLTLERFNLAETQPDMACADEIVVQEMKKLYTTLRPASVAS